MSLRGKMAIGVRGIVEGSVLPTPYDYEDPSSIHLGSRGISVTVEEDGKPLRREFWNWRNVVWYRIDSGLWPRVVDDQDTSWDRLVEDAF